MVLQPLLLASSRSHEHEKVNDTYSYNLWKKSLFTIGFQSLVYHLLISAIIQNNWLLKAPVIFSLGSSLNKNTLVCMSQEVNATYNLRKKDIFTIFKSSTPSFASCNNATNLAVKSPSDFSCRLGVLGELKSAAMFLHFPLNFLA